MVLRLVWTSDGRRRAGHVRENKLMFQQGKFASLIVASATARIIATRTPSFLTACEHIMQDDAQKVWQDFRKIPNRVRY
jgi:hypothetical protein